MQIHRNKSNFIQIDMWMDHATWTLILNNRRRETFLKASLTSLERQVDEFKSPVKEKCKRHESGHSWSAHRKHLRKGFEMRSSTAHCAPCRVEERRSPARLV